jgi:hypothetical protein
MAFFRLADLYLTWALTTITASDARIGPGQSQAGQAQTDQAQADPDGRPKSPSLRSLILAEKGLLFSEMSLLVKKDSPFLLQSAGQIWAQAEEDSPGASRYARARWAAWTEPPEVLAPLLAHTAEEQVNLLWPSFGEARLEPSFKGLIDAHWFKTAWFGYSR